MIRKAVLGLTSIVLASCSQPPPTIIEAPNNPPAIAVSDDYLTGFQQYLAGYSEGFLVTPSGKPAPILELSDRLTEVFNRFMQTQPNLNNEETYEFLFALDSARSALASYKSEWLVKVTPDLSFTKYADIRHEFASPYLEASHYMQALEGMLN